MLFVDGMDTNVLALDLRRDDFFLYPIPAIAYTDYENDIVRSSPETILFNGNRATLFAMGFDFKRTCLTTDEGSCMLYSEGHRFGVFVLIVGMTFLPSIFLLFGDIGFN